MLEQAYATLEELGRAVDLGITDFALIDVTPADVYGALLWALDERADLSSELETTRNEVADMFAEMSDEIGSVLFDLEPPYTEPFNENDHPVDLFGVRI